MRRIFIGAAIILVSMASAAVAQVPVPGPYREGSTWATVNADAFFTDSAGYRYRYSIDATKYKAKPGDSESASFTLQFVKEKGEEDSPDYYFFQEGSIDCPTDISSLAISSGEARFAFVVEDPVAAGCEGYVLTVEVVGGNQTTSYVDWTASIDVTGMMSSPAVSVSNTDTSSALDNRAGVTFRYSGQGGSGWDCRVGGVSILLFDGDYVYVPFADPFPNEPADGTAVGTFSSHSSRLLENSRKPIK